MTIKYEKFVSKNVRRVWAKQFCIEFLKGLESVSNKGKAEIEEYCKAKKAEYIEICKTRSTGKSEHSWENSASTNMSDIRKAIKQWQAGIELTDINSYEQPLGDGTLQRQHIALAIMNFPKKFHKEREQDIKAKKKQQREKLVKITNIDVYQETIEKLLQSDDFKEISVGLVAATGRRPSEILSTAGFKQVGKFEVTFTGQLKTKGEERAYTPYTLVDSHKVCDALLRLRRMPEIKELKKNTLAEIDSRKNSGINRVVVNYFGELIEPPTGEVSLSAKNLRAAYAAIAIYLFCPWTTDPSLFVTENLGHANDSIQSNYRDYEVTDINGKPLTRGAWIEKLNEEMEEVMEVETQYRIRTSKAVKEAINDQEFLPYPDQLSRLEELVRLAKIGKQYESGELQPKEIVKEVVVEKVVEKVVEVSTGEVIKTKEVKENVNPTQLTNEQLFSYKAPNTGQEKMRRAVKAIKDYNQSCGGNKQAMWAINTKSLKDLTNCRTQVINNYLSSDDASEDLNISWDNSGDKPKIIIGYNKMMGFTYHQNKGKGDIKTDIKL